MNRIEHYHDWLRDAHAMEKQAESMLESMASRIDNYPELRARIEQHLSETKNQIVQLETILDRNDISRSVIKDSMSKIAALGQSIGVFVTSPVITLELSATSSNCVAVCPAITIPFSTAFTEVSINSADSFAA